MEVVGLLAGLTYTSRVLDAKGSCLQRIFDPTVRAIPKRIDGRGHNVLTDLARDEIAMMDTVSGRALGVARI